MTNQERYEASHLTTIGASFRLTATISVSIACTSEIGTHS